MKKLLIAAAALGVAALTMPAFVGTSEAASAQNPMCKYMAQQRNPMSWDAYYHCYGSPPKAARVAARTPRRTAQAKAKSPYCAMASSQRNVVAWNAYYHCLNR